tara:strand:+ start:637 stop:1443 length:807 start_codon:yes stop_codon:yes gene_type:complete
MITFSKLGNWGRLGNQMFQYAMLYSVAKTKGFDFWYPYDFYPEGIMLHECFSGVGVGISDKPDALGEIYVEPEGHVHFDPLVFEQPDNTEYFGYFQNSKYFSGYEEELRKQFTFKEEFKEAGNAILDRVPSGKKKISLHVRRTDYLVLDKLYTNLDMDYYNACLNNQDKSDSFVLVFSDDVEWCVKNFKLDRPFAVVDTSQHGQRGPYIEMYMMTQCDVNIIANSSFSWWAAWLSDNDEVYAPLHWFNPENISNVTYDGFFPKKWKLV